MDAVKQRTVEMHKEDLDRIALEISRASESLWEGAELEECYDAIQLEKLWPILDKYIKVKKNEVSD